MFFFLSYDGEAERVKSNQVKTNGDTTWSHGKDEIFSKIAKLEAHLRVAGLGYIETVGSNPKEAVGFIGLFVRQHC